MAQLIDETGEISSRSLWEALHDADLIQITSDPMERTVTMVLDIENLREFAGLPVGLTWRFVLKSASILLARRWEAWPGPRPELHGLNHEEQNALVADYQAKGRTVSVAWSDFEHTVSVHGLWISDTTLQLPASEVVLEGYGHTNKTDTLFEFKLVGEQLQCERSDGHQTSIEDLSCLGEAYWKAFSRRTG